MAQRQFRSDDTSTWAENFGTGSDGALTISANTTDAPIDSACTGTGGATSLSATNGSFATGQLILIHQTQGTGAGNWELNKIASYSAGTITTSYSLINTYGTGAQVIVLKQYSTVTINGSQTLTGKAWNGTTGGLLPLLANTSITVTGILSEQGANRNYGPSGGGWLSALNGGGFRGGASNDAINSYGYQGESSTGTGTTSSAANGMGGGGGGGNNYFNAGGGGGYGTAGNNASGSTATNGSGGGTGGVAGLTTMFFGGGGGGATGTAGSQKSSGSNGGGVIFLCSPSITITGGITVNGGNTSPNNYREAGGSGAGGSVLLKGQTISLGSGLVTSVGGVANDDANGEIGGAGGVGRIHADYLTSISGTTNPTIDSRQDSSLIIPTSGGLFFAQI